MSQDLFSAATKVREHAYAPYSGFRVGAAIRAGNGQIYTGCNVENVSYPQGCCAEAGAVATMVADGQTQIAEVLVIADAEPLISPCGGCRQRLAEFASDEVPVHMADLEGVKQTCKMGELLPARFSDAHLESKP